MRMRYMIVLLVLAAGLSLPLSATSIPAPNLVLNGDLTSNCGSWVTVNTDKYFCQAPNPTRAIGSSGGYVILNNNPGIVPMMSQALGGLVIGSQYALNWDMRSAFNCCNSANVPGIGVAIDGHLWQYTVLNNAPWTHYSLLFTYTGISNVLVFTAQRNGTDSDGAFDNIVVSPTGVPEPASFSLLLGGLLSLAGFARRRG
jgi:hypothetical protein